MREKERDRETEVEIYFSKNERVCLGLAFEAEMQSQCREITCKRRRRTDSG